MSNSKPIMADEPTQSVAAPVETMPSLEGGISALASANAPFVYFDAVPFYGYVNGVGSITLAASRLIAKRADNTAATDHVVTGHLRASVSTLCGLRDAIDGILLMAAPKPDGEVN